MGEIVDQARNEIKDQVKKLKQSVAMCALYEIKEPVLLVIFREMPLHKPFTQHNTIDPLLTVS